MFHCFVSVFWHVAVLCYQGKITLLEKKHDERFPRYNISLSKHKAQRVV